MNLMDLFIKIGVDDQASGSINQLTSFSIAKGNLMSDAIKKGLSAMVDLGKQSIMTYADFEQLQGGIKKLFGDEAMNTVMKNADVAYKTAGMSANQYLETTTSFAASLIAGLKGDTEKAAELSDMAIKDMADNANTFGSDISTIQNAYQNFAKQNYQLLDNLRLGYGGTASEMARLINDSGVLGDKVTVTASNLNRVSFDKMIEAIHAIQEEMGITGTTEAEAGGTIAGSLNQTKSAWDNLMVAMVNDPEHVTEKWNAFADSFGNSAAKIWEAVKNIGRSLGELFIYAFPEEDQDVVRNGMNMLGEGLKELTEDLVILGDAALRVPGAIFSKDFWEAIWRGPENKKEVKATLGEAIYKAENFDTAASSGALLGAQMSSNGGAWMVAEDLVNSWIYLAKKMDGTYSLEQKPRSELQEDKIANLFGKYDNPQTEEEIQSIIASAEKLVSQGKLDKESLNLLKDLKGIYGLGSNLGSSTINITINGAQYSSEEELAEVVARKLGQMIDGKGAVKGYAY